MTELRTLSTAPERFSAALESWRRLLGPDHVHADEATRDRWAQCTLPQGTRPRAVLEPADTEQVCQLVRAAAAGGVPLYPVSRGRNWGYGDACAVRDGQVIVSLARLNRIIEVNTELAYAVVEPGVTQGQLSDHLRRLGLPLWLDVTGAGPGASVLGNAVERGFGHTPYGDHFRHSCGMQVVLADGRLLETGFGQYAGARAAHVFPAGVGPWLDGLFTQSNLGIVTRLGVWLMPVPEACEAFYVSVKKDSDLAGLVEAVRELRLHEVVRSTVHFGNDLKGIAAQQRYPWDRTGGRTPLPAAVRGELRRAYGLGAWGAVGGLYGTKALVAAARAEVRRRLRPLGRLGFYDARKLALAQRLGGWLRPFGLGRRLRRLAALGQPVLELLRGVPSAEHLRGAAWRSRRPTEDMSAVGLLWQAPVLPAIGAAAREVSDLAGTVLGRYRFDPILTFSLVNARALCCLISLCFDRDDAVEAERARECDHDLFEELARRGYLPYRAGIRTMPRLDRDGSVFWQVCGQLKGALDPENILAPGRYEPGSPANAKPW